MTQEERECIWDATRESLKGEIMNPYEKEILKDAAKDIAWLLNRVKELEAEVKRLEDITLSAHPARWVQHTNIRGK